MCVCVCMYVCVCVYVFVYVCACDNLYAFVCEYFRISNFLATIYPRIIRNMLIYIVNFRILSVKESIVLTVKTLQFVYYARVLCMNLLDYLFFSCNLSREIRK